jgi:beta-glucuronidase
MPVLQDYYFFTDSKITQHIMNKTMKKLFTTICLFLGCMLTISAEEIYLPLIQNVQAYESLSLNGEWNYIVDVQEEGYYDYRMNPTRWGFFQNAKPQRPEDLIEYDFDKSPTMLIPSDWNTQDERLFFYEGTVWFKKSISIKKSDYATSKALLYFGAINYDCRVWVNTKEVGHHIGGFTPFNYDVTDLLKDGENTIIVKVDNKRHAEDVPTQIFDWWNYGGITRNVMLVKVPTVYLENYSLQLQKADAKAKVRQIDFFAQMNKKEAGHKVVVFIPELKLEQQLTTDAEGTVSGTLRISSKKLQLWSPENPKLYDVRFSLDTSTLTDEIGFRTIETRDKQILLNGKPIFLKGISIHNEKPNGGGRANSAEDARTLLGWAKELGCNFVRLAHYPHHEEMVREAEKMGILVWSEIPVYWTIAWKNPKTYENARNQLRDMILRDHNRANIIIWSIANETPHSKERDIFLGNLAKYARSQDSTRLISMAMEVTGASNYVNRLNDNMNQYVDVLSFNQYIGWYRDVNDAPKMKWEIPYNKPVIVSEFGGGAKFGYHGDKNQRWTEEFQENLYQENCAMLDKIEGLAGTTPWILKDFRSPRRVLPDVQDYYNRKGLFSDKGEKKKAFYVLKQWYEGK